MVRFTGGLLLFSAFSRAAPPERPLHPDQAVLHNPQKSSGNPRKLQGKFLHVTDFHPDPFYKTGSKPSGEHPCHKGAGKGPAGYYGAEATSCDSPYSLVNETFKWIEKHIKDEIDFVVWTGDSARHDNDEQYPRNDRQVQDQNKYLVHKFVEVFGKDDNLDDPDPTNDFVVPIVPTFGNNDILPHNIFTPGPNRWTRKYEDIWQRFVPQAQRHSFARGGWFFTEVIPNRLAVFSLNTLYFFDSNSAVDGCDAKSEPGYEHFEWLRIQLQFLRQRGMKAILIGHVPPARTGSKRNWDETCHQRYVLWLRQYRDVVVGSVFGHMNLDHFMFQDVSDLKYKFEIEGIDDEDVKRNAAYDRVSNEPEFSIAGKAEYLNELRHKWSKLPKPPKHYSFQSGDESEDLSAMKKKKKKKSKKQKYLDEIGGLYAERFSLSFVSPSVVPNYFPSIRVIEYNITGLEHDHPAQKLIGTPAEEILTQAMFQDDSEMKDLFDKVDEMVERDDDVETEKKRNKKKNKKNKKKKPKFHIPKPPSSTSLPGPAYSSQALSLLAWTQYYANLTSINAGVEKEGRKADVKKKAKHFQYEIEYATNEHQGYNMTDLTMRSWLDLAKRLGQKKLSKSAIEQSDQVMDDDESEVAEMDVDSASDDDLSADKHKKHEKKTGKGSSKPKNHMWRMFVRRAFVGTKDEDDLEESFG